MRIFFIIEKEKHEKYFINNNYFVYNKWLLFKNTSLNELKEKAEQGDKLSMAKLVLIYQKTDDYQNALKWLEEDALSGNEEAINELGNVYLNGLLGVNKDYNKAFGYYQKASDIGYFDAINNLGYMYDLGLGIKQDRLKAIEIYEVAATKGSIRALYNLGISYINGLDGVPKDIVQAYKYLDIARYNTQFSKNMNLKWSIRARLDELDSIITISQKKEAIKLAEEWTNSLHKK